MPQQPVGQGDGMVEGDGMVPWHQDGVGGGAASDSSIALWIALDDVSRVRVLALSPRVI